MALRNILNYTKKEILNDFKISRASAIESAMNSMITEGFTFTEEEKTLYNDIAKGDKDLNSVDEYVDNLILKWKKEKPEIFTDEK